MEIYRNRKKGISIIVVVVLILATAAITGFGVYKWQDVAGLKNQINENKKLNDALEKSKKESSDLKNTVNKLEKDIQTLRNTASINDQQSASKTLRETIQNRADQILRALNNRDMASFASYVHPEKGVRFSPYANVNIQKNVVISAADIPDLMKSNSKKTWGEYDGSGDPIKLTLTEYINKFVYDVNFLEAPQIIFNQTIQRGNSTNNIKETYPDATFIEYHFPGFEAKYDGMDWRSLNLIFESKNGIWYLVGIVHNQWTI